MFKFFSKTRFNLIGKSKTGKYFKYAIGEIFLVVIGILIALQINAWNQQRKDNSTEQVLLKRLQKEYLLNQEQLKDKIAIRDRIVVNCKTLLDHYRDPDSAHMDSVILNLSKIITPTSFDPIQNDLVASGAIEMLKNEDLKQLLIQWSTDVIQLQETEQQFYRYHEQNVVPYLDELGVMRDVMLVFWANDIINMLESNKSSNPFSEKSNINKNSLNDLLNDSKLESQISYTLSLNEFNNRESETLMKRIKTILTAIEGQIKE